MFRDSRESLLNSEYSVLGVTGTLHPSTHLVRELAEQEYPDFEFEGDQVGEAYNPHLISGALYLLGLDPERSAAFSVSFGYLAAGGDFTVHVIGPAYVTAAAAYNGGQGILQFKAYESSDVGLAVGASYRVDRIPYDRSGRGSFLLYARTISLRGVALIRLAGVDGIPAAKITGHLGYVRDLQTPSFGFTLVVGGF